jgi:hypothetical protein
MAKYFATSTKIISNVENNILGIFPPHHQKMFKKFHLAHELTFMFIGSQYNILVIQGLCVLGLLLGSTKTALGKCKNILSQDI